MDNARTLPRPMDRRWLWVTAIPLIALNAHLVADQLRWVLVAPSIGFDFDLFARAASSSEPYSGATYVWSPLALPLLAAVVPLGFGGWTALHFLALVALRDWRLIAVVLLSWPFWFDVVTGNVMVFVVVAAWSAWSGSRWGTAIFLVMGLLMPRPLMLPLMAWILWQRPEWRVPFAASCVVLGMAALATGYTDEWITALRATANQQLDSTFNWAPSRWIGVVWLPIGAALAVLFTLKGRLGLASLAMQPYWFPQYLLMLLLEARPARRES